MMNILGGIFSSFNVDSLAVLNTVQHSEFYNAKDIITFITIYYDNPLL